MPSFRVVALLALAAAATVGLAAVVPGATSSAPAPQPAYADEGPVAHAAGGDVVDLHYPSVVNVRLVRARAALERATALVDQNQGAQAVVEVAAVRANMAKAWNAAKYVIKTTPPPVAAEAGVAHSSGDAPLGPVIATPEETALEVLNLEHEVVTTGLGIVGAADATLFPKVTTMIHAAQNARDAAIAYIHSIAPPPVAAEGRVHADASGAPVVVGWDTQMPLVIPLLADEIQQIKAVRPLPRYLRNMRNRDFKTRNTINQFWPPVPPQD